MPLDKILDDLQQPQVADDLARFGDGAPGGANRSATINYNVPLPGSYSWERVVPLALPVEWFQQESAKAGTPFREVAGIEVNAEGEVQRIDAKRLAELYRRQLAPYARPSVGLAAQVGAVVNPPPIARADVDQPIVGGIANRMRPVEGLILASEDISAQVVNRQMYLDQLAKTQQDALQAGLKASTITLVTQGIGQSIQTIDIDLRKAPTPKIALVETWELRSSLGDYGLGRTLQTFTLLPGERTTITVETWRTDAATREDASSIFDSSDVSAQSRFGNTLTQQSGSAFQDQGGWSASFGLKASAWANFVVAGGEASLEAGFAANHQEARQTYSSSVSNTAEEHSAQVNNSRRQAVESRSSDTTASGTSNVTFREIANTNLRRVLNFVFRELNQTYETFTILRNVRLAFYNGNPGSGEVVALADLRKLLNKHIVDARREEVARTILAMAAECLDQEGTPTITLQVGTRPEGHVYKWDDIKFKQDGTLDFADNPINGKYSWRFKPGKLGARNERFLGLITNTRSIVLRTDNVVVEALLGQADALDPYASALQALDLQSREADIQWRQAEIAKTTKALELVDSSAANQKVDAYTKMLEDKPDIEVVPVASVNNRPR